MNLVEFLRMMIAPEFTWIKIRDPKTGSELACGFADDLMDGSALFLQHFEALSYHVSGHGFTINVRRITNE